MVGPIGSGLSPSLDKGVGWEQWHSWPVAPLPSPELGVGTRAEGCPSALPVMVEPMDRGVSSSLVKGLSWEQWRSWPSAPLPDPPLGAGTRAGGVLPSALPVMVKSHDRDLSPSLVKGMDWEQWHSWPSAPLPDPPLGAGTRAGGVLPSALPVMVKFHDRDLGPSLVKGMDRGQWHSRPATPLPNPPLGVGTRARGVLPSALLAKGCDPLTRTRLTSNDKAPS